LLSASTDCWGGPWEERRREGDGFPDEGLFDAQYLLATLVMFQAGMAEAMLKNSGADATKLPAGVRANRKFMEQNQAALLQMHKRSKEIERETKKLTARDASKGDEAEEEAPPDESADKQ